MANILVFLSFITLYVCVILCIEIPNSCINQPNSDNFEIKPINNDKYPILNVKCANEFAIIDINKDNNWLQYFSSYRLYHYAVYGPIKDDHSNWNEWFIPSISYYYLVSPDCTSCDISSELNIKYSYSSSYYMTPIGSQCTQIPISRIACDMDFNTYECRVCESSITRTDGYWKSFPIYNGINNDKNNPNIIHNFDEIEYENQYKYGLCMFTIRNAYTIHINDSFQHCKTPTHEDLQTEIILPRRKPSIGSNGKFCMCIKPKHLEIYNLQLQQQFINNIQLKDSENINRNNVKLYNSDFIDGTYRIKSSGTYIIMEDIIFDFNAPNGYKLGNLQTYNNINDWWPNIDQNDIYPGAGDNYGSYFLGFWAGITIECNDVILDLNGHKLQMSNAFYYQQSFFVIIALSSQIFLPGQGPGFFGANIKCAENVIIRNGEIGLSSHHGIHGHFNKHILIENIKIYNFKTHGIQFNGFDDIYIKNVDIGNNIKIHKLSPFYAQMRHLLASYRKMRHENKEIINDLCLTFYGRNNCITMNDLINDLINILDMAFEYAIFDKTFDDNKLWNEHKYVLINAKQSPQTATLYGIFLNYVGSNVIGWYAGNDNTKSYNILIENVNIHDLYHNTFENIGFSQGKSVGKQRIINCLSAPFNAYHIFGKEQVEYISYCNNYFDINGNSNKCIQFHKNGLKYIGNKIVDIQIFAFKLINDYGLSWDYCFSGAADMNSLVKFAFNNQQFIDNTPLLIPSHDPMIHPGKGVLGLRLNGIENGEIKNVCIENIYSDTDIGTLLGGKYLNIVSQQQPYMNGYSMNMVNGLSLTFAKNIQLNNIQLNNIESKTGLSYGIALWYDTQIDIINNGILINNIYAGKGLIQSLKYTIDSYPNLIPEACAIRIYDDDIYKVIVQYNNNINIKCVIGHIGCLFDDLYSHIGDVNNENECQWLMNGDELIINVENQFMSNNYLGLILLLLVIVIGTMMIIYYCSSCVKDWYESRKSLQYSEITPLL